MYYLSICRYLNEKYDKRLDKRMTNKFNKDKSNKDKMITKYDLQIFKKEIEGKFTDLETKIDVNQKSNEEIDQLVKFISDRIDIMGSMLEEDIHEIIENRNSDANKDSLSERDFLFNNYNGLVAVSIGLFIIGIVFMTVVLIHVLFMT